MNKNLDFILKSIIIYITLGFAICATVHMVLRYTYYAHTVVFIGFYLVIDRLISYDKQKNVKFFKRINIVWLNLLITGITIFCIDSCHLI
jgi:hypothetical protein